MWNRRIESGEGERTKSWGEEIETVQQKGEENKKMKPWKQRVLKGFQLKRLWFGLYDGIKFIKSGLYGGGRMVEIGLENILYLSIFWN